MKQSLVVLLLLIVINVYGTLVLKESVDENDIDINSLKCYKSIYLNKKKPQTELHSTIINCDPKEEIRCFNVKFNYSLGKNSKYGMERGCMALDVERSAAWLKWIYEDLTDNRLYPSYMEFKACNNNLCNYISGASTVVAYCTHYWFLSAAVVTILFFKMT